MSSSRRPVRVALALTAGAAVATAATAAVAADPGDPGDPGDAADRRGPGSSVSTVVLDQTKPKQARDARDRRPSSRQIARLFDTWNAALATGDAARVSALYAPDGILLSTLSADIREGRAEIAEYFEHDFLPKSPQGVITESHVDVIDEDTAMHNGLYDFTVTVDGESAVVPARFTYVYEKIGGRWLIASHHSSVQP